jgi:methyl-accepting chemotaxis protein
MARLLASLRQLTRTVRAAADDTTQVAQAITAGGAHMAATAQHIADTSNDLSRRAGEMAGTIDALVADAGRLVAIAAELSDGAQAGVARNAQLRQVALESGARLVESAAALETLATDAHSSAAAVEALAHASEEIQSFVTLVTKMARQSKLLALNAAMEAARAGEQGQGFAVVANEVRRLAASSSEAAERTEALVKGVLERVAESRAASARAASTVDAVRAATELGLDSFRQVEDAAREAERWTGSIERAATRSSAQVGEMNGRLGALAQNTQRFASAMEEVAAASQEQSASTEEIAAAGAELLRSADRLSRLTTAGPA